MRQPQYCFFPRQYRPPEAEVKRFSHVPAAKIPRCRTNRTVEYEKSRNVAYARSGATRLIASGKAADLPRFAALQLAGGLDALLGDAHLSRVNGLRGQAAAFEKARRPEPLVDPQ